MQLHAGTTLRWNSGEKVFRADKATLTYDRVGFTSPSGCSKLSIAKAPELNADALPILNVTDAPQKKVMLKLYEGTIGSETLVIGARDSENKCIISTVPTELVGAATFAVQGWALPAAVPYDGSSFNLNRSGKIADLAFSEASIVKLLRSVP